MTHTLSDVMNAVYQHIPQTKRPKIGLILGSGLASLSDQLTDAATLSYADIPGLKKGTVKGHASELVVGSLQGIEIACLRGRLHLYEGVGYEPTKTFIYLLKSLGCEMILLTCAAGSLLPEAGPGELMMITDHINFHPGNPLVGENNDAMGPRFVGMENAYDRDLQQLLTAAAQKLNIPLYQGVYLSTLGPSFETPAEIRAFKRWGADAVGMSVVPEVIAARHCNIKVACVAAITNLAAGMSDELITHEGSLHFGEIAAKKLIKLIPEFLKDYACSAWKIKNAI